MVKIKELINTNILNSEWVGFQGDSEFIDKDGELQMGYWTFKAIVDHPKVGKAHTIDDEISNELIFGGQYLGVRNSNGNICIIGLYYLHSECKKCKHDYQSYHCMGCQHYYSEIEYLEPFCNYCENTPYEDACENCVWNFSM